MADHGRGPHPFLRCLVPVKHNNEVHYECTQFKITRDTLRYSNVAHILESKAEHSGQRVRTRRERKVGVKKN